jgi:hypothetical protein
MVEVIDQDQEKDVIVAAPGAAEAHLKQPQERRRSERLKKDITLTTKEKNERMARKRNLEGTHSNQNMFSVLPLDEIAELSSGMGVIVNDYDFGTFDMLRDLECARQDLFNKQNMTCQDPPTETVGGPDTVQSPLCIEWLQEENSDNEDFILVLSKKKKAREKKRNLKISPSLQKMKQIQEAPGLQSGKGRKNSSLPVSKKTQTK